MVENLNKYQKRVHILGALLACCKTSGGSNLHNIFLERCKKWNTNPTSQNVFDAAAKYQRIAYEEYKDSLPPVTADYMSMTELRQATGDHGFGVYPVIRSVDGKGSWRRIDEPVYKFFPDE